MAKVGGVRTSAASCFRPPAGRENQASTRETQRTAGPPQPSPLRSVGSAQVVEPMHLGSRNPSMHQHAVLPLSPLEVSCHFVQLVQPGPLAVGNEHIDLCQLFLEVVLNPVLQ